MQIWKIASAKKLEEEKYEARNLNENEIKIKFTGAFLSEYDKYSYNGFAPEYPIRPVSLAVGRVSEAPQDSSYKIGERVVVSPYVYDKENDDLQIMGKTTDGFLGDFAYVPINNVDVIPEGVTDKDALFIDHVSTALNIWEKLNVSKADFVVIMGADALSIILAQLCIYYQAIPIIVSDNEEKLEVARSAGVYYTINLKEEDPKMLINSYTGGAKAKGSVYIANEGQPLSQIFDYTAYRGSIAFVSTNSLLQLKSMIATKNIINGEFDIKVIKNGYDNYTAAMNLLAIKEIKLDNLISKTIKYANIANELESATSEQTLFSTIITY